jgi:predicted nucleic acid-binding protein
MLIYFDSVIAIYLFDPTGPLQARAVARLATLQGAGDSIGATDRTRLECRVKPMRTGDAAKLAVFDAFFARADVQLLPITTAVFDRATQLRAAHNFKLGDSLHLTAAIEGRRKRFLTNDTRLSRCPDIPVEVQP